MSTGVVVIGAVVDEVHLWQQKHIMSLTMQRSQKAAGATVAETTSAGNAPVDDVGRHGNGGDIRGRPA